MMHVRVQDMHTMHGMHEMHAMHVCHLAFMHQMWCMVSCPRFLYVCFLRNPEYLKKWTKSKAFNRGFSGKLLCLLFWRCKVQALLAPLCMDSNDTRLLVLFYLQMFERTLHVHITPSWVCLFHMSFTELPKILAVSSKQARKQAKMATELW